MIARAWTYILLSDYLGYLAAKGHPTSSLQSEHCRRVQLKFPASGVQRQLALDLSMDAKSKIRPLLSYVHTRVQLLSHQRVSEHV